MFVLQPILDLMHGFQATCFFIFGVSYQIGKGIFYLLTQIFIFARDILNALIFIGEEFYRFTCELDAAVSEIANYVQSSTNCGVNSLLEAISIFCRHMLDFVTSTRLHTKLLATSLGSSLSNLVWLVRDALVLIADTSWWLISLLPRLLIYLLIFIADGLVFSVDSAARVVVHSVNVIIEDLVRLSIGVAIVVFLILHRRSIYFLLVPMIRKIGTCLWYLFAFLQRRLVVWRSRRSNAVRRTPLPRSSVPPGNNSSKVPTEQRCVVCFDRQKDVVLIPCRHLCLCEPCMENMLAIMDTYHCPLCRCNIRQYVSVYV